MLFLRLMFFMALFLSLPKGWNWAKGPSSRQLGSTLLSEEQNPLPNRAVYSLSQPFTYWKKGSQFYVFLGRDRRTVLKIPRFSKLESTLLKTRPPHPEFLLGLQAVSQSLMEEAAALYVHYGRVSQEIPKNFALRDRLGRTLSIDLNQTPFVLQERKKLLSKALEKAKDLEQRKRILRAFLNLIEKERSKGWVCSDKSFWLNVCYEDGRAWRIDVGSYVPLKENFSLKEVTKPVVCWIKEQNNTTFLKWFEEELAKQESFFFSLEPL